jgi:hypothetical protein
MTKTGRYTMNPAHGEHLDRAAQEDDGREETDRAADRDGADGNSGKKAGAEDGKDGQKKGAVKRIEIEPAENGGFVSRTHRAQSEVALHPDSIGEDDGDARDGGAPPYQEPELRAHPDAAHLLQFLAAELTR